jgi:hypothetical protein
MKHLRATTISLLIVLLSALSSLAQQTAAAAANAAVPPLIQFSNIATDDRGNCLSGVVNITFSLYAAQQGGEPLWNETQNNVQLDSTGHYSVQLGITKASGVPTTLFTSGEARWLGVRIAEQVEQPRVLLLSVPYALKAGDAATIGGLPPSAFVLAAPALNSAALDSNATTQTSAPPAVEDVTTTGGTTNYLPLFNGTATIVDSVLFQSATSPFKIGINTTTPVSTLDVKGGGTIRGILSLPATGAATAAAGKNSQALNLAASAFNSTSSTALNQTFQWQAEPAGNHTDAPSGTLNLLFGEGATKPSETGLHIASDGQISFAAGQTFPGAGTITGVTTASGSGLTGGGTSGTLNLSLTNACAANQILQYNGSAWACVASGTVTSIASGAGLTGGPITGTGTLSIAAGGVTNAMLAGSYAQLGAANTFTAPNTFGAGVTAAGGSYGVYGTSTSGAGVSGAGPSYGVYGTSATGNGVYGENTATSGLAAGVYGTSASGYGMYGSGSAAGVYGTDISASGGNDGVYGTSPSGNGVYGTSLGGYGVYGASSDSVGVVGKGGVGVSGSGAYGVDGFAQGNSTTGRNWVRNSGVWGDTGGTATTYVGVSATADENTALLVANNDPSGDYPSMTVQNNTTETHNPVFQTSSPFTYNNTRHCTIDTSANLTCTGVLTGSILGDAGKQTAVYAMQSAENWLEDAGSGQLSNGTARIELDPAFAQTVNAEVEYHVFLTPKGDSDGLYVSNETPQGFEVHEQHGGHSSIAFDYRIMAKRKGYENVRLEDLTERFKQPEALLQKTRRPPPSAEIRSIPAPRIPRPLPQPFVAPRPMAPMPVQPKSALRPHSTAQASKPEVTQK